MSERCTYVSASGQRCPARAWLELDHREARARGGEGSVENLRVFCKAHNQYEAEQAFGRQHVEKKIAERRASAEKATKALASDDATSPKPSAEPPTRSAEQALHTSPNPDAAESKASAAQSKARDTSPIAAERSQDRKPPTAEPRYATLKRALVGLGFRAKEVDSGIATLSAETWSLPMEGLLREALAKLT